MGRECGRNWEAGIDVYMLLYIKQITNENDCRTQGSLLNVPWRPRREGTENERAHVCVQWMHFAVL